MANYEEITALVEEVRDILHMDEAKLKKKKGKKKGPKTSKHNPFMWRKVNGPTDGVVANPRRVGRKNDWRCKCSGYSCMCKGIGAENKGHEKKVRIDKAYKRAYNKAYFDYRMNNPRKFKTKGAAKNFR